MITEQALLEAIAECQGQRNPNASTCIKLASYYTILDKLKKKEEQSQPMYSTGYSYAAPAEQEYSSETEFMSIFSKIDRYDALKVIDELMETLRTMQPRLYDAVIRKLASYE